MEIRPGLFANFMFFELAHFTVNHRLKGIVLRDGVSTKTIEL
jgi:hypothetical protein